MLVPNLPTPEGRALGVELARLTDAAESEIRATRSGHPERCGTCAFRAGTIPNGCPSTVMDAIKSLVEIRPFFCHEVRQGEERPLCVGWSMAIAGNDGTPRVAPWPYSDSDEGGYG